MTRLPIQQRYYVAQKFVSRLRRVALLFAHPIHYVVDFFELFRVRRPRIRRDLDDVLQVAEEFLLSRLFQIVHTFGEAPVFCWIACCLYAGNAYTDFGTTSNAL